MVMTVENSIGWSPQARFNEITARPTTPSYSSARLERQRATQQTKQRKERKGKERKSRKCVSENGLFLEAVLLLHFQRWRDVRTTKTFS
jgi:hypothetical protein